MPAGVPSTKLERDSHLGRSIRYHSRYQTRRRAASGAARAIFNRALVCGVILSVFDAFGRVLLGAEGGFGILAERIYRGVQRMVRLAALPIGRAHLAFVRVVTVLLAVICHAWRCPVLD